MLKPIELKSLRNGKHHIYVITNLIDGKQYVGVTKDPYNRWITHQKPGFNGKREVNTAIFQDGADNFTFEVMHSFDDLNEALKFEGILVKSLKTLMPMGYNKAALGAVCETTREFYKVNMTNRQRIQSGPHRGRVI